MAIEITPIVTTQPATQPLTANKLFVDALNITSDKATGDARASIRNTPYADTDAGMVFATQTDELVTGSVFSLAGVVPEIGFAIQAIYAANAAWRSRHQSNVAALAAEQTAADARQATAEADADAANAAATTKAAEDVAAAEQAATAANAAADTAAQQAATALATAGADHVQKYGARQVITDTASDEWKAADTALKAADATYQAAVTANADAASAAATTKIQQAAAVEAAKVSAAAEVAAVKAAGVAAVEAVKAGNAARLDIAREAVKDTANTPLTTAEAI